MQTLIIKDLAVTEELDREEMAAVRGGYGKSAAPYDWSQYAGVSQSDFSFNADQLLSQSQNTLVNNGNNVAFADNITANVNPTQTGSNNINFGH